MIKNVSLLEFDARSKDIFYLKNELFGVIELRFINFCYNKLLNILQNLKKKTPILEIQARVQKYKSVIRFYTD